MKRLNVSAAGLLRLLVCVEVTMLLGLMAWLLALRLYVARLLPLAIGISACAVAAVVTLLLVRGIARYARRHRLRYSLRTQLLLVAILGLGLGLLLDPAQRTYQQWLRRVRVDRRGRSSRGLVG